VVQNPAAIWVNAAGRRFVNEAANSKLVEAELFRQDPATHWLIFDDTGKRGFSIRDAPWLNPRSIYDEILNNPEVTKTAADIETLAEAAGLPAQALVTAVRRFNAQVQSGEDWDFQRFGPGLEVPIPAPIVKPPFYAVQLFPTTRKSMGGPVIDLNGRVLNDRGQPIPGLYAAGELTGVAGINGSHGGSGTFLGPSLLTGRVAGRSAAAALDVRPSDSNPAQPRANAPVATIGLTELEMMLGTSRPGYWHFEISHELVIERKYECGQCHNPNMAMAAAVSAAQMLARLATCTTCH
jgi:succinate dehydrogenase/fumarate reductase flavoprotein subunit